MNKYSRIFHHISIGDVKEKNRKTALEAQRLAMEEREHLLKVLNSEKHYDWRKDLANTKELSTVEEKKAHKKRIKQRKLNERRIEKRIEDINKVLDEGMSSKGFEYLYGLEISSVYAQGLHTVQSTFAQDIVNASTETTDYQFGQYFPGSYANSIGDTQITSMSKVDAVAFLDTRYGLASGSGGNFTLSTSDDSSGVLSKASLASALGINIPNGVPNGNFNGNATEGSAISRLFSDAKPGKKINFNWTISSSEKGLPKELQVDDFAFIAINGRVSKISSIISKGLQSSGQFIYTLQPGDISGDGTVRVSIGVVDVYDALYNTTFRISNFGSLYSLGSTGDTTDAADLGMSVDKANPNKKKKDDTVAQLSPNTEKAIDDMLLKGLRRGDYGDPSSPGIQQQIRNLENNKRQNTPGGLPLA